MLENGNVIWYDGRNQLELEYNHEQRQKAAKQASAGILLSTVVCSTIAIVGWIRSIFVKRKQAKKGVPALRDREGRILCPHCMKYIQRR
jgi:hypothetical protein